MEDSSGPNPDGSDGPELQPPIGETAAKSGVQWRFCPTCGAPWVPESLACTHCQGLTHSNTIDAAVVVTAVQPVRDAILLYFAILIPILLGAFLVMATSPSAAEEINTRVEIVISWFTAGVIALWSIRRWRAIAPFLSNVATPRWYVAAVLLAGATYLLATVAVTALVHGLGITELEYADPMLEAGYGWGAVILNVCIEPAIFEEIAFRGIILAGLQRVLSNRDAALVSSLMFMVLHLAVPSFPHLFLIGLALCYLRIRSRSLYPGMLMHFLHNFLIVISELR